MKFDFAIGNPPYNEEAVGDNKTFQPTVYDKFMDSAFQVAQKVELIHPAKFLFNAGRTPEKWNEKMLNDEHFKILDYQEDATKVFPTTEIKSGIVISYRDESSVFGAIGVFVKQKELNDILHKVICSVNFKSIQTEVVSRTAYRFTELMHKEHPEIISQLSKNHEFDMSTNIFKNVPQLFFDSKPTDGFDYIQIFGRDEDRVKKFIRKDYVNSPSNLNCYKVFLPSADGKGFFGERLTSPEICSPGVGATETFVGIGRFKTKKEAVNMLAYIKTKFLRAMLGVLKTTHHITPKVWKYVPLQDFTSRSDIDWSKSISEIDEQLYNKYGLSPEERDFIETHVKEME